MLLEGKAVIITGAARGIGRASAKVLAEHGANVGVADIQPEVEGAADEVRELGRKSAFAVFDVSDPKAVQAGTAKLQETLGHIDILVNCAGIVNNIADLTKMTFEAWQWEISVNLTGAFNMIQALIEPMIEKNWGRIINISSGAAISGLHRQAAYAASKAGLLGLTKTVTIEHARHGITCNAILPGLIGTELVMAMPEEIRNSVTSSTPARRVGKTSEVGQLIAFLASDNAAFISSAAIPIDGGGMGGGSLGSRKELKGLKG